MGMGKRKCNEKFCHICKKKFRDLHNSNNDTNDYSNYDIDGDSHGEEFDIRKIYGNFAGLDDVDDYHGYDDDNDDAFDARKFQRNAAEFCDDDHDDEEDIFHIFNKNYKRVREQCCCTRK